MQALWGPLQTTVQNAAMESSATPNMPSVYRAWLLTLAIAGSILLASGAQAQPAETVERGRILLVQYQCGSCHAILGVPATKGETAQNLRAWSQRSYIAGRLPNRPDILARWVANPQALVPGTVMPNMGVPLADAHYIAAYLFSLE